MRLKSAIESWLDQEHITDPNIHSKPETGYFSAGFSPRYLLTRMKSTLMYMNIPRI